MSSVQWFADTLERIADILHAADTAHRLWQWTRRR